MANRITLNQLHILSAVAKTGSITKAGEAVFLTQPAVSINIKLLEEYFETPLIEIINKRSKLTEAGKAVCSAYQAIKSELTTLDMTVSEIRGCIKGTLKIAMVSTAKFFIPYIVGDFISLHSKIETKLKILNRQDVINIVKKNECDFAILSQIPKRVPFTIKRFAENPLVIIASPENSVCKQPAIELKSLIKEKWIVREEGSGIRQSIENLFRKKKLTPNIAMEVSSTEAIKQMVMANIGIGLVPKLSLKAELKLDKIKVLNVTETPIKEHWHIAHLKNKKLSPLAKKFIQHLISNNQTYTSC